MKTKTTIQIDKDVAQMLHNIKSIGESYSEVIRKILKKYKE